jgi:hypothetical protein
MILKMQHEENERKEKSLEFFEKNREEYAHLLEEDANGNSI